MEVLTNLSVHRDIRKNQGERNKNLFYSLKDNYLSPFFSQEEKVLTHPTDSEYGGRYSTLQNTFRVSR